MLRSERLLLRDFRDDDFEAVHAYATDLDVVRYMTWGPNSEADTRDTLQMVRLLERQLGEVIGEDRLGVLRTALAMDWGEPDLTAASVKTAKK